MADDEQETPDRYELSPQQQARRDQALESIVQLGDPVLRSGAIEIKDFDQDLISFGAHMVSLMDDAVGVGLAAPQVGRPIRMFVYRVDGDGDARGIVNPVIEAIGDETDVEDEGCLSLIGIHVPVERPVHIRLKAQTVAGQPIDEEISGFSARIIQHETDHLNGVLILDKTTPEARRAALKALHTGVPMPPASASADDAQDAPAAAETAADPA